MSIFGILLFFAGIILLGDGLLYSDMLAVLLGGIALLFCFLLSLIVWVQPKERLRSLLSWNTSPRLIAELINREQSIGLSQWILPPFLRIQVRIRAKIMLGGEELYRLVWKYSLSKAEVKAVELIPPVAGEISMVAVFSLGDIFGITRRRIFGSKSSSATVLPSPSIMPVFDLIQSLQTEDDLQPKQQSDSEKIFVRDYQAGDRARDINWKASGRIHKLLTRVPPESESPIPLINIVLLADCKGLELSYLKSLLRGFIDHLYESNSNLHFRILLGADIYEIRDSQTHNSFLKSLALHSPSSASTIFTNYEAGKLFEKQAIIFSHKGYNDLLPSLSRFKHYTLMVLSTVQNSRASQLPNEEDHIKRLSVFQPSGFTPAFSELRYEAEQEWKGFRLGKAQGTRELSSKPTDKNELFTFFLKKQWF